MCTEAGGGVVPRNGQQVPALGAGSSSSVWRRPGDQKAFHECRDGLDVQTDVRVLRREQRGSELT